LIKKDCNIQWKQYLRISTFIRGKKATKELTEEKKDWKCGTMEKN